MTAKKLTIPKLKAMHKAGEKLTMITAYDTTMARLVDAAGIDIVLVGDSLGMVIQGHENTLPVTVEDMIYHTRCVARGLAHAHLMVDMPFLSYQASKEEAVYNAGRLIKEAHAQSVKIEGGEEIGDLVWYLTKIGIPVMAHIGLKPQSVHVMGGYKMQGKDKSSADQIFADAQIMAEAGAFALLLEGIPIELAARITNGIDIPTIGIGSGPHCSGQVLVCYDLLGSNPEFQPRFVKHFCNLAEIVRKAVGQYVKEVKDGTFPTYDHGVNQTLSLVEKKRQGP